MSGQSRLAVLRLLRGMLPTRVGGAALAGAACSTLVLVFGLTSSAAVAQVAAQPEEGESTDVAGVMVSRGAKTATVTVDALLLWRSGLQDVAFTKHR